jgi:UDP-glucose 4-epimerase
VKILFTGASSFTGFWFVRALARAGHEITATFRRRPAEYPDPVRRQRAELAARECRPVYGCGFGDGEFIKLASAAEVLCHHAAEVTNYRSPDFNVMAAVENNTRNLAEVCGAVKRAGGHIVLTGSVFEPGEGAGSQDLPAVSPYGLSKGLTWEMFRYYAGHAGVPLGKFVIPNPFGPYEEPRFTAYLMQCWRAGQTAVVNTPAYVRDTIHVSLLARAYQRFVAQVAAVDAGRSAGEGVCGCVMRLNPSGYAESQGAFAQRFAAAMRTRLGWACDVEFKQQTEFSEPRVRVNRDVLDAGELAWKETEAWDEVAEYYRTIATWKIA